MKASQRSSITVRVWNEAGLIGITSTSDLSQSGLEKALTGAKEASRFGNADDVPGFSPLAMAPIPELDRPLQPAQGIQTLLTNLKAAEHDLLAHHQAIETVPYNGLSEGSSEIWEASACTCACACVLGHVRMAGFPPWISQTVPPPV